VVGEMDIIYQDFPDHLVGASYFITLDLTSGYYQMRVEEYYSRKTTLNENLASWNGWSCPLRSLMLINDMFRSYIRRSIIISLDDIVVLIETSDEPCPTTIFHANKLQVSRN
jgi:hypothetical protein